MATQLADRIRSQTNSYANSEEIRMFGGVCFTLNGNMHCCAMRDGNGLFRVGPEQEAQALALGARGVHGGRAMKGFVIVSADQLGEDKALKDWIALAADFVEIFRRRRNSPADRLPRRAVSTAFAPALLLCYRGRTPCREVPKSGAPIPKKR